MRAKRALTCTLFCAATSLGCERDDLVTVENKPPVASAQTPFAALAGEVVELDGSRSHDPDGRIVSHAWDFGDGTSGEGQQLSHIYLSVGSFTVTLTVTDDDGASDQHASSIEITDNDPPVAVIDAPATAEIDEVVRFSGAGSYDGDGSIASYAWYLSDGTTAEGEILDHGFSFSGAYTATLTVTDDVGYTGEATHDIEVATAPPDYSGTWNWYLTDESLRDLGLICGTFQDSTLIIDSDPPLITITEQAGSTSVVYSGTLDGVDFDTQNSQLGIVQRIYGSFTSATAFDGTYALDPGFGSPCEDRPVSGIKAQ